MRNEKRAGKFNHGDHGVVNAFSSVKLRVTPWFLILPLLVSCKSAPQVAVPQVVVPELQPGPEQVEPEPEIEMHDPVFTITSISIEQATLINTLFKCTLKIDNPNTFSVNVSSLRYELYGNGRLWGSGREKDLAAISAKSSLETEFSFEMNFIDMPRSLLDDVIAMKYVRYRFTGDAEIGTDMPNFPPYRMVFDLSGNSEVKK